MQAYTVAGGRVSPGIALAGGGGIEVGEGGRGRKLVVVPPPAEARLGHQCPGAPATCGCRSAATVAARGQLCPECVATDARIRAGADTSGWLARAEADQAGRAARAPAVLVSAPAPGRHPEVVALVLVRDHSGYRGGWRARAARPDGEWAAIIRRTRAHRPPDGDGALASGHTLDAPCPGCDLVAPLPLESSPTWAIVAEGQSAQGDAGRMGGGPEYLALLRPGREHAVELVRWGRRCEPAIVRLEARPDGTLTATDSRAAAETAAAAEAWS